MIEFLLFIEQHIPEDILVMLTSVSVLLLVVLLSILVAICK